MEATCDMENIQGNRNISRNDIALSIIAKVYEKEIVMKKKGGGETKNLEEAEINDYGEVEVLRQESTWIEKKRKKPVVWDRRNPVIYNMAVQELAEFNTFQNSPLCQDKFETIKIAENICKQLNE